MAEVTNEAELLKEKANKFFKGKSQDLSSLGFITGDSHRLPRHNYLFFCSNLTSFPLNRSTVQMLRRANAHFKLHSFEQRLAVSSVAVSVFWWNTPQPGQIQNLTGSDARLGLGVWSSEWRQRCGVQLRIQGDKKVELLECSGSVFIKRGVAEPS